MIIKLTHDELRELDGFRSGNWFADGYWLTEHLACRGLLVRDQKVEPLNINQNITDQKYSRAMYCSYRITRRGIKALQHHRLEAAV